MAFTRIVRARFMVALAAGLVSASGARIAAAPPLVRTALPGLGLATNVARLRDLNLSGQRGRVTVDLQADVLGYNASLRYLFLRDPTGVIRIQTGFRDLNLRRSRVRFEASCLIGADQWPMLQGLVVDQQGNTNRSDVFGVVCLDEGPHALRLLYWQKTGEPELRVLYEGPDLRKQRIPDQALFRRVTGPDGSVQTLPGLRYDLFAEMPQKDVTRARRFQPAGGGVTNNFNPRATGRTNAFALEFSGFLTVPKTGQYTFSTSGKGNCLLFLDEDKVKVTELDAASPGETSPGKVEITTARELRDLSLMGFEGHCKATLDGVVCHANPDSGMLVFRDATGAVPLCFPPGQRSWPEGEHIVIKSFPHLRSGGIFAGQDLVVDNDKPDRQAPERGGAVELKPGPSPFYLDCLFNGTNEALSLTLEGANIPRQAIPASMLFRRSPGTKPGGPALAPGLNYAVYRGVWSSLPAFGELQPWKQGWTTNLSGEIAGLSNGFGIRFSGFINVPTPANYHFRLRSQDGSRLFFLKSSTEITAAESMPAGQPRQLRPGAGLTAADYEHWGVVEGRVQFAAESSRATRVELVSAQGAFEMRLLNVRPEQLLPMIGGRVRACGIVTRVFNPEGPWGGVLEVPDAALVEPLELPGSAWETPLSTVQTLSRTDPQPPPGGLVRLVGKWAPGAGQEGRLVDASGAAVLCGRQAGQFKTGTLIEAVGRLRAGSIPPMLAPVFCRELAGETASASSPESLPTLTSLEQVHQLSASEAQRHYPVRARGILISGHPAPIIQDATRGVYVSGWTNFMPVSTLGDYYEVEGVTDPGGFSPIIKPAAIRHLGAGQLPQPRHPSLAEIKTGSEDAQWTELDAVVQQADGKVWQVAVQEGILRVRVAGATPEWCAALKGAVVRMQGVPMPVHNNHRQLLEVFFHVPSPQCVCVQKPPLADPFQLPQTRAADLLRFNPLASLSQGVRVQGQVVHSQERMLSIVDGSQGVKCFLEKPAALEPGDQVEVAGFPETGVFVPVLRQTKVRRLGPDSLPPPPVCSLEQLLTGSFDGTRVRVQGRLASQHTEGEEAILNLQMGPRLVAARLPARRAAGLELDLGSLLEVTATCNGLERDAAGDAQGRRLRTFDLLVNSARDVRLLVKPSWWNIRHAFAVMAAAGIALLLAIAWIGSLRSEVASRTRVLEEEIETRKQTEARLNREVEERARAQQEVERVHQELMLASRKAGMAEVATGVLHNVGNVLNSINVSATCAGDRVKRSRITGVQKLAALLQEHAGNLAGFFARDDRARQLPGYVESLARSLEGEQQAVIEELGNLRRNVEHVREIVSMQQAYARVGGVVESVQAVDLAKDALLINEPSFQRHQIRVRRDFNDSATLMVDRHKVLQILVNLLSNAKRACQDAGTNGHSEVVFRIQSTEQGHICFEISDNGVGIPAENLTRIFVHGFTTHKDGHGFGLHTSAITAKELGGGLTVHSDGPGKGATFTLQLPNRPPAGDAKG